MAVIKPSYSMDKIVKYFSKYKNITVKAGTYDITKTITVYSDCKVTCEPGVVFQRKFSGRMIEFNASSQITGYNGTHNVQWTGGTFIASTNNTDQNVIVLYHCKDIELTNIVIDGCRGLHSLELNSSKNVKITGCTFKNQSPKPDADFREAIQIDFAGKAGLSWHGAPDDAPSNDGTHCQQIVIDNCTFDNCPCGVGTHSLSVPAIYHEDITITNCKFSNILHWGIKLLGMRNVTIKNCPTANIIVNKKDEGHLLTGGKIKLPEGYRYNENVIIDNIKIT